MSKEPAYDPIPTRLSLLARLKDWEDQTGWREFFDTYHALLYNTARRAGLQDSEAQEAVQETVIAVAKKLPEFKANPTRGSFSAWLLQSARWRIADQFRRRARIEANILSPKRQPETSCLEDSHPTDFLGLIPDPRCVDLEAIWHEEWERNVATAALAKVKGQVSLDQYQMFDLHKIQGLSASEAARLMKVTTASVYMASHRILRLLKKATQQLRREIE